MTARVAARGGRECRKQLSSHHLRIESAFAGWQKGGLALATHSVIFWLDSEPLRDNVILSGTILCDIATGGRHGDSVAGEHVAATTFG